MSKGQYKEGMADAMRAYKDFGEKQEAAIRQVGAQIEQAAQKVDKLGDAIDGVTTYITDREKAELYQLHTPIDIADLEDAEKRILLAILYQLATEEEEVTDNQQNYVRAVQQYLKIYNPQTMIHLEAVENIEDISAQKAVLQASLEFFYLGTHPGTYTDDQMDFLDCFQINRKTRKEIIAHIEAIIEVIGIQGLAEKYGIVAEQPVSAFATYTDNGSIPEKVADLCVSFIREKSCDRIQGKAVLETKDYLVLCKTPLDWEDNEKEKELSYGLFSIHKRTGKISRININYEKEFPFHCYDVSFCIQENTIYFIQNKIDEWHPNVRLVSIDFSDSSFHRLPFQFAYSKSMSSVYFRISCNQSYIMVYAYGSRMGYVSREDERPISKIFVMDLAHGNRVFMLEPDLIVRDAFIHEDTFFILGSTKREYRKDRLVSLFQYDVASRTATDALDKYNNCSYNGVLNGLTDDLGLGLMLDWVDDYEENYFIEDILRIEDVWYFKYNITKHSHLDKRGFCFTEIQDLDGKNHARLNQIVYQANYDEPIYWYKHSIICRCVDHLMCYDLLTNEKKYSSEGVSSYILLGDYLYRSCKEGWYKANLSQVWDSLQWELISDPA